MITVTNVGTTYDAVPASQGLGIAFIYFPGPGTITFACRVNKIGTGTQSWQLWNETDAAEVGALVDAGAVGIKTLQQAFAHSLTGLKLVRVRVRSTVGTDDPAYLGAAHYLT